jgi:hypothetical protein
MNDGEAAAVTSEGRLPAKRKPATAIYLALVTALERRIRAVGLTMQECDDAAGLQDGYCAKLLHPDTPSGRQANWPMLQLLCTAVYPEGFTLSIKPAPSRDPLLLKRLSSTRRKRGSGHHQRYVDYLEMSRRGGLHSHQVRMAKYSAEDRKRIARKAARARWSGAKTRSFGKSGHERTVVST